MKLVILFLYLLFVPFFSYTQTVEQTKDGRKMLIGDYLQASEMKKNEGDYKEASHLMNGAAIWYWEQKQYDKSINCFQQSIKLNEIINNEQAIIRIKNNLGMIYADLRQYELAYEYFVLVLEERKKNKEPISIIASLVNISVITNNLKQYDKSIDYLNEALVLALRIRDAEQMRSCYGMLAEVFEKKGDTQNMLKYFELYKIFHEKTQRDKITKVQITAEEAKLRAKVLELENQMKDNRLLEKDTLIAEQERELQGLTLAQQVLLRTMSKRAMLLEIAEDKIKIKDLQLREQKIVNELETLRHNNIRNILSMALGFSLIIAAILWQKNKEREATNLVLEAHKKQLIEQSNTLLMQAEELKETNKVKDKLFSLVAHDLRNPLNSLKGVFFLVQNDSLSLEELQDIMSKIEKEVLRIDEMMANLLFWAQSQLSSIQTKMQNFDVIPIIYDNFRLLEQVASSKNISLTCDSKQETMMIYADINQIRIIIRNLVTNAIKFTEKGKITIYVNEIANDWQIEIKDTGVGMNEDQIAKLFHTNTHFTTQGTASEKGSGLGLLLCKEFVENHHGKIWVTSKVGEGTSFFFTILQVSTSQN